MRWVALLIGCGFHGVPNGAIDASADDLTMIETGTDLAGAPDLAQPVNRGPGPLGALPPGFCCDSDEQCRSRACIGSAPRYCTDECGDDTVCTAWGAGFACDTASNTCVRTTAACIPPDQYQYGSKPTGTCCSHGFPMAGQECLGGLCNSTGNSANPFYCTQGCNTNTPCPGGYSCLGSFCWISQTVGNDTYLYMCQ